MFSIIIKGERNLQDIELVKLTMVFYKTGYPRVPKVLYITGPYSDWQKDKQCFVPNSAENISKNSLLQKEKLKYLKIAEKWEYSRKNWIPIELAHYFDKKNGVLDKYTSVSEIIKQIETEIAEQIRIRNGREFDNRRNARTFQYLHNCLERFTLSKYQKVFTIIHSGILPKSSSRILSFIQNAKEQRMEIGVECLINFICSTRLSNTPRRKNYTT